MKKSVIKAVLLTTLIATPYSVVYAGAGIAGAGIAGSFNTAKNRMYKELYPNNGLTFYTNCDWSKKKVDLASCGLQNSFPKKQMNRASRTEAEHVIPASWMLKKHKAERACVEQSKSHKSNARTFCQSNDIDYRNAHNDLVNLRPIVGQINANRSNKPFAEVLSGDKQVTYRGGKEIKISSRTAVLDPSIRGDVARIAFYMRDAYKVEYSARQAELFDKWNRDDPVDAEEIALNEKIKRSQGVGNHYVK